MSAAPTRGDGHEGVHIGRTGPQRLEPAGRHEPGPRDQRYDEDRERGALRRAQPTQQQADPQGNSRNRRGDERSPRRRCGGAVGTHRKARPGHGPGQRIARRTVPRHGHPHFSLEHVHRHVLDACSRSSDLLIVPAQLGQSMPLTRKSSVWLAMTSRASGQQAPDLRHQEAEDEAQDHGEERGDGGPADAAGFLVDGVDRGAARIMEQTEQHQVEPGEHRPPRGAQQVSHGRRRVQLEHHTLPRVRCR